MFKKGMFPPQIKIYCKNKRYLDCSDPEKNLAGVSCEGSIYFLFTQLQEIFAFTLRQRGIGGKQKEEDKRLSSVTVKLCSKGTIPLIKRLPINQGYIQDIF